MYLVFESNLYVIFYIQLAHMDCLDRTVLTDATTHVMDVTDSMVLVILGVTPDGRDMTVNMVIRNVYMHCVHFFCLLIN